MLTSKLIMRNANILWFPQHKWQKVLLKRLFNCSSRKIKSVGLGFTHVTWKILGCWWSAKGTHRFKVDTVHAALSLTVMYLQRVISAIEKHTPNPSWGL